MIGGANDGVCPPSLKFCLEGVFILECVLENEVRGADFRDQRLADRLVQVAQSLGQRPQLSLPAALTTRAELEAAYRFFANSKVTPQAILTPHFERTRERIAQTPLVVLVQDTTEIDLTRPREVVKGAGPMDCQSRRGGFVHPLMAFDAQGLPLGLVSAKFWARSAIQTEETPAEKRRKRQQTPIEDKESFRWLEGLRLAREVANCCPDTQCLLVADSEADIYELFAEPRESEAGRPLELLIRACQDRAVCEGAGGLVAQVRATPVRAKFSLNISARTPKTQAETRKRKSARTARTACVEVRAQTLTLRPPPRPDRKLPPVRVNVVLVEEVSPPENQEPVQWILITTLPIASDQDLEAIIAYYCQRWDIEVYFRTVKSGCRVEERQFEYFDRELNYLAVCLLVAWRIMWLCRLGQVCPDVDCDAVFTASEWQSVYQFVQHRTPPKTPPSLNEMICMIASLGGYIRRKNSPPGTQTLWIGMQRMHDLASAWEIFGPGQKI
jgi:hypothetical protein